MTTFTIAISDDLEIGFFADGDGDPEAAQRDLQKLIDILGQDPDVVSLDVAGPIENHRDEQRMTRVHDITHAKSAGLAGQ
jgi:hypothetical protein